MACNIVRLVVSVQYSNSKLNSVAKDENFSGDRTYLLESICVAIHRTSQSCFLLKGSNSIAAAFLRIC